MSFLLHHHAQDAYLNEIRSAYWRREIREPSQWLSQDPRAEEKMLAHHAIGSAVAYRCALAAGQQWKLVSRVDGSAAGDVGAMVGTELLNCIRKFSESRRIMARAFFHGRRHARIIMESRPLKIGDGRERMWWVPVRLEDVSKNFYRMFIPRPDQENPQAIWQVFDKFGPQTGWRELTEWEAGHLITHTYTDDEEGMGWGRGLREQCAWIWYTLSHVSQESIGAIERFARGLTKIKIDGLRDAGTGQTNTVLMADAIAAVEDAMARHVVAMDALDEVETEQMSGIGGQMLADFRQELKDDARTVILNAVLPTGGGDSSVGSLARAEVEEGSTVALVRYDREALEETLEERLIGCVWWRNQRNLKELGLWGAKPRMDLTQDKAENPQEVLESAEAASRIGLPLSKADIYKRGNLLEPMSEEDTLRPPAPVAGPLGGGFGQAEPFGAGVL